MPSKVWAAPIALLWASAIDGLVLPAGNTESIDYTPYKEKCKTKPVKGIIVHTGDLDMTVESLNRFACDGGNAIEVEVWCSQKSIDSTEITCPTPPDKALENTLKYASCIGMSTFVSMVISTTNDGNTWCAHIGKNFGEEQWDEWFKNWQAHLEKWGNYSQSIGVEMMSVGAELNITQPQTARWRKLIAGVRSQYKGKLTYGADKRSESTVEWWDALDVIGSHAYYRIANHTQKPTVMDLREGWKREDSQNSGAHFKRLKALSEKYKKPLVFLELGYRSMSEAHRCPGCWATDGDVDYDHQADLFEALYETWCIEDWWHGVYFMGFSLNVSKPAVPKGYEFIGTKAEEVMAGFNGGPMVGDKCSQDLLYRAGCKAKVDTGLGHSVNGVSLPSTAAEKVKKDGSPTQLAVVSTDSGREYVTRPKDPEMGAPPASGTLYPLTSYDI